MSDTEKKSDETAAATDATAGTPGVAAGAPPNLETEVIEAMRTVFDPEIPVNIYDLGLIYDMQIAEGGNVKVKMTLTAPACPVAGEMPGMVSRAIRTVEGVTECDVELVWDPPWNPDMMSADARLTLNM
jgi:FeS assembly SUF system protein